MKKSFTVSALSFAMSLGLFSDPVSAELSTQVIQDLNQAGNVVYWTGNPIVYGNTIAWMMKNPLGGNYKNVYYWDGETIHEIGFRYKDVIDFDLYDGTIAWLDNTRKLIHYWDGTYDGAGNPVIETIVDNSASGPAMFGLSLDNGKIVWSMHDGQDEEIYMWDGTYNNGQPNIVQITDNDYQDAYPSYSDGMIAWRSVNMQTRQLVINYWDGANVHELTGPRVANEYKPISTNNGGVAWKSGDGNIYYWDGTFDNSSNPNIMTAASGGFLGIPTLDNGNISYFKHDFARPDGEDEAVFYWNGSDTFQVSEWYNAYYSTDAQIRASSSSGGLAYVGVNATTNTQEVRFVTTSGLCF